MCVLLHSMRPKATHAGHQPERVEGDEDHDRPGAARPQAGGDHSTVSMNSFGVCGQDRDLPDAGKGYCCMGAAVYGPNRCTCWEEEYDLEQAPLQVHADVAPRALPLLESTGQPCHDCAYRSGSPERRGDSGYSGDADELDELAGTNTPFWCHKGMRRVARVVHPSGVEVPGHPAAYQPPVQDGVPYCADGQPARVCAGWLARRRVLLGADVGAERGRGERRRWSGERSAD